MTEAVIDVEAREIIEPATGSYELLEDLQEHDLEQGSPEWLAYRMSHRNASDTPIVMGASHSMTRTELMHAQVTGLGREFDEWMQRILNKGHEFEGNARAALEARRDDEYLAAHSDNLEDFPDNTLYTKVFSRGVWSASMDGITSDFVDAFEHKTVNQILRDAFAMHPVMQGKYLPLEYRAQMEHQLMVSGAKRVIFVASTWEWSREEQAQVCTEWLECEYLPDVELRRQIVNAWAVFEHDKLTYTPAAIRAEIVPVAKPHMLMPLVQVEGRVVNSNMRAVKEQLDTYLLGMDEEPDDDQGFADAKVYAEHCAELKERFMLVRVQVTEGTTSISELVEVIDSCVAALDKKRITLNNAAKAGKDAKRLRIVTDNQLALDTFIKEQNTKLPAPWLPATKGAFGEVIKGKRSFAAMEEAAAAELANCKTCTLELASRYSANYAALLSHPANDLSAEHEAFADKAKALPEDYLQHLDNALVLAEAEAKRIAEKRAAEAAAAKAAAEAKRAASVQAMNQQEAKAQEPQATAQAQMPLDAAEPSAVTEQEATADQGFSAPVSVTVDAEILSRFIASQTWPSRMAERKARSLLEQFMAFAQDDNRQ